MSFFKNILHRYRTWAAPFLVITTALVFLACFGRQTFELPLLGDHCMKTSKSVEVAYNLVRYDDFFHEYNDWKAGPKNPRGKIGSILRYESPLSALGLGAVYLVVDGTDFDTRLAAARIFTLLHLAAAYLLLAVIIFRKDLLALAVFSFLFIGASFTVSYSTKPLAETYALLYQALLAVGATHLLKHPGGAIKKALLLAGGAALLCLGGKMNYFLVAFPLITLYPLFDREIRGMKSLLKYFAPFAAAAAVGVSVMLLLTNFSFYNAFVYMIRGNKPIIDNSLWATFVEGFEYIDAIIKRTRGDFGGIVFDWGRYSLFYLAAKFPYCIFSVRKRPLSLSERFSAVLSLLVLGHLLNYIVLRNLFIPHRYYVVPLFMLCCLSLTVSIADLRSFLMGRFPGSRHLRALLSNRFARVYKALICIKSFAETRAAFVTAAFFFSAAAAVAGYFSYTLSDPSFQTTAILALKTLGAQSLAIEIIDRLKDAVVLLKIICAVCITGAVLSVGLALFAERVNFIKNISKKLSKRGFPSPQAVALIVLLLIPGGSIVFQNGRIFYDYAASHLKLMEYAAQLAAIRKDTVSGDLVLSWKPCIAFYADKRSILEPVHEDLPYYRKNDIHSVMGPVKPFHKFYKRIEKYPPPMSYWEPKTASKKTKHKRARENKKNENQ